MPAYVDTSAWIALHEPRDANHERAREQLHSLVERRIGLLTGWHSVVEFADGLARHYDQRTAADQVERILTSRVVRVVSSEPHLRAALDVLRKNPEWGLDASDALSAALMRAEGVGTVFTYDSDFTKLKFNVIG
ncbi:MAG TPA: PIN domain-containing protein [Candidatus Thermoplasmatota archaeon]|nr:PIN domain-containing protein [Candidatus Thermoplasmatota archaeon]